MQDRRFGNPDSTIRNLNARRVFQLCFNETAAQAKEQHTSCAR